MVAPAGPRSIAITRACLVSGRCWLLDATAVDAAARGGFICGDVGLRAVGRTDLRCFDLAPAPLAAPECFNVVLVMGSSWHQRSAIHRTTEAPPRPPGRRGGS